MILSCIIYPSDLHYIQVGWTWTPVCDCHRGGWKCDQSCLENALIEDSLFYPIGIVSRSTRVQTSTDCLYFKNLYNNLTYLYPEANIWVIGHSLGGALSSLLGVTFGVPTVTFEAPGAKMAAQRLHLPIPVSNIARYVFLSPHLCFPCHVSYQLSI